MKKYRQTLNTKTGRWIKIDVEKNMIVDQKDDFKPFKGIRKMKRRQR